MADRSRPCPNRNGIWPPIYDRQFDPDFVRQGPLDSIDLGHLEDGPRRWIAARCTDELREGDVVNICVRSTGAPGASASIVGATRAPLFVNTV